jgi:hypothetical protein
VVKSGVEIPLHAKPRMDLTSFIGKLLEQEDVDALRKGCGSSCRGALVGARTLWEAGDMPFLRAQRSVCGQQVGCPSVTFGELV